LEVLELNREWNMLSPDAERERHGTPLQQLEVFGELAWSRPRVAAT